MSSAVKFKDFNFKLAIIEIVMYEQNILVPRFDVYRFAKSYTGRQIDIEQEGHEIIPEVKRCFEQLEISASALLNIEEINQDGSDIYLQLCPFWDGEDDTFNIQSADDAAMLPRLKAVTLFYDEDDRILQEFQQRGIVADWV